MRIGGSKPILVAALPRPPVVVAFDGTTLTMTLPSGRAIHYPGARLVPNAKFEDGDPDLEFFDNAKRQWKRVRGWFGTFVENLVQGTARDLLAAALLRAEARGWSTVFHCHDEIVIEAPENTLPDAEVLAMLMEPPVWAIGLPLNGKVHRGPTYLEAPATREPPEPETEQELVEHAVDAFVATTPPNPDIVKAADEDFLSSLTDTVAPLYDFVTLPMTESQHVSCPFHDDPQPSCKIYPDHWHCFGCGRHGGRLDWLCEVEGMTKREPSTRCRTGADRFCASSATTRPRGSRSHCSSGRKPVRSPVRSAHATSRRRAASISPSCRRPSTRCCVSIPPAYSARVRGTPASSRSCAIR